MTLYVRYIAVLLVVALFQGCLFYWHPEEKRIAWDPQKEPITSDTEDRKNSYNLSRLEQGMTREEVYTTMGMPDLYADYESISGDYTLILYYYSSTDIDDGAATMKEVTPVVIFNGKLAGWDKQYYANMKKPDYLK